MPHTQSPGPAIYYETSGNRADEPLVVICGLSAQLIWWRDDFVQRLVERRMFVIRLDNRDVGLSAKLGGPGDPAYSLVDMAGDVCRVLDELKIDTAHIVGQSLGGGIAQAMAISHPGRTRSMVLFYTVPAFAAQFLTEELLQSVATAPPSPAVPATRERAIEDMVERERMTGSTAYPFDEAWTREYAARCYDRSYCPDGVLRQLAAAVGSGDRSAALAQLTLPTAVIHGRVDRLVKIEASLELGRLIPDCEIHIYPGMGHEIVKPLWNEFIDIIARTAARAMR
jgi:pimeloyl-ACP methyl ester carboxylesterase